MVYLHLRTTNPRMNDGGFRNRVPSVGQGAAAAGVGPVLNQLQLLSFLRSIDEPDRMDGAVRAVICPCRQASPEVRGRLGWPSCAVPVACPIGR
jgi:hypothetical protein